MKLVIYVRVEPLGINVVTFAIVTNIRGKISNNTEIYSGNKITHRVKFIEITAQYTKDIKICILRKAPRI